MHLNCPLTSCRVLSLPPDFAFCLRVRRRGDVKLEGNAINTMMSNAAIVDFSVTMFGTSVSDISSDNNFFNVSESRNGLSCVCGIDADCHAVADCMAAGTQRVVPTVVSARAMPCGSMACLHGPCDARGSFHHVTCCDILFVA